MNCRFLDRDGRSHPMVMGCYGIGVGRTMAAVIEQCHDKYGPVWPMSIAPYHVHIVAINPGKAGVGEAAEELYRELWSAGCEVLLDDRGEKAGTAFNDADLIGCPVRLVLSPRTVGAGEVELKLRDGSRHEQIPREHIVEEVKTLILAGLEALA